jgi:hypothetical protein
LLDLTTSTPRLLLSDFEKPKGPYDTLSHCWGSNPSFMALWSTNLPQFQLELPVAAIPKTFVDAIEVTRSLGLKYLWIDSLCILQSGNGSEGDWVHQVRDLGLVYANCAVNISADYGRSPEQGCFIERNALMVQQCNIMWGDSKSPPSLYTVVSDYHHTQDVLRRLPLLSRAWVVQERLLSPRVLHFGAEQIFWECAEEPFACESLPFGVPHEILMFDGPRPFLVLQGSANQEVISRSPPYIDAEHIA